MKIQPLLMISTWFLLLFFVINGETANHEIQLEKLKVLEIIDLKGEIDHVQGIAVDDQRVWISSVHRKNKTGHIHLFDYTSRELIKHVEAQTGEQYHPGGMSIDGDHLWIPVAMYTRYGNTTIECRDKNNLEIIKRFFVDDHIGCLTVNKNQIIGGNWDARIFYLWDKMGNTLKKVKNPRETHYQDIKMVNGLLVASGLLDGKGIIDWLTIPELDLHKRIIGHETNRGVNFMQEGMAIHKGKLYLLPEDGPHTRLFIFEFIEQ